MQSEKTGVVENLIDKINLGKFDYTDLEKLASVWDGKVCIRGAGFMGTGLVFDILITAGFHVDCFVDINKAVGTIIKGNAKIVPLSELSNKKILFVIAVGECYQKEVINELRLYKLSKYIIASLSWEQQIVRSVKESGDESANEKYSYWTDDAICAKRWFKKRIGYELDLANPQTFNEKLQWLKLNDRNPFYTQLVDKYNVKKYVSSIIGREYIIPTLGVWSNFSDIDFKMLPDKFVLKCTHDSGSSVICQNKSSFNFENAMRKLTDSLSNNYYYKGREWPYKNVQARIICEKYLEDCTWDELLDYKIMCFNGKAKCSFICSNRKKELKVNFYDREWKPMPFWRHYHKRDEEFPKPCNYEKMIELAEVLSKELKFVRVDFYNINGKIYFSEMTLYPGNGLEEFHPAEWDGILGNWLNLY